jgi:glycerol-3-phosphate dehydrogenase
VVALQHFGNHCAHKSVIRDDPEAMESSNKFDLLIIGGGPAGGPGAMTAATAGARVAVIERDHLGGT